jgi:hypothetical protein
MKVAKCIKFDNSWGCVDSSSLKTKHPPFVLNYETLNVNETSIFFENKIYSIGMNSGSSKKISFYGGNSPWKSYWDCKTAENPNQNDICTYIKKDLTVTDAVIICEKLHNNEQYCEVKTGEAGSSLLGSVCSGGNCSGDISEGAVKNGLLMSHYAFMCAPREIINMLTKGKTLKYNPISITFTFPNGEPLKFEVNNYNRALKSPGIVLNGSTFVYNNRSLSLIFPSSKSKVLESCRKFR